MASVSMQNTLVNLTVPLSSEPSRQGLLMPKLKYRFRVTFDQFGIPAESPTELTKQVMDFTRPTVTFDNIDLPIYNSTIRLAGKHSWGDITCTLRDDAGGNVSRLVGQQLQKQLDFMEQSSAPSGIDYKFNTIFEVLDGGNGVNVVALETWEIFGCYLQGVNYGDANYGTGTEPMTVSMTIRFDNALQLVGVGTPTNTSLTPRGSASA